MNARLATATLAILGSCFAGAQEISESTTPDPVLEAIREFNKRDKSKPNEVSVVLDPVGQPPAPVGDVPKPDAPPAPASASPVEKISPVEIPVPASESPVEPTPDAETPKPEAGLVVRVEKLHSGNGSIDPAQVKLLAPFPAKQLSRPPAGWHLNVSDSAPPFTREVEIAPGTNITLSIRPHLLVPDADGASTFAIPEPGFDNTLGYQQTATVGAILANSVRELDDNAKQLGAAMDSLQQLLVSLPKLEAQPAAEPEPPAAKPVIIRKR